MKPSDSAKALMDFLGVTRGARPESPADMLASIIQFYVEKPATALAEDDLSDMLLFQYGCYDWGQGERFEIDVTRQFIAADECDDDALSQLHFTMYYEPDDILRDIGRHNQWCQNRDGVAAFRAMVLGSPAVTIVAERQPVDIKIAWDPV